MDYAWDLRPISQKPQTLFGPVKPFLHVVVRILKTKKSIGMKLCMQGTFGHIKKYVKEQLCKLKV